LGITPALIVGDLDSLSAADVLYWNEQGVQFIRHDQRKDETDLELALLRAQGLGRNEALVLGALGGRWDQTFANLLLPAFHLRHHNTRTGMAAERRNLDLWSNAGGQQCDGSRKSNSSG
jgi:thiamine pyrophosphokinase